MQYALRRLAKKIVSQRHRLPAPAYNKMRSVYRALISKHVPAEFDDSYYAQNNPHISRTNLSPYAHFHKTGHKDLRSPNPDFDIVWYLQNYGHTFDEGKIDAFSHYLKKGKSKGYTTHPPRDVKFDKTKSKALPQSARRACLFAAYDPDGIIDDYVLVYLKELARHADVFYLADCEMSQTELAKLDGIVKGAWAERHGAYDFGSYSRLASQYVGWDKLTSYDEVVLVNDSAFLVSELTDVFSKMSEKQCAWWGLQASKGIAATLSKQPFPADEDSIDLDVIKSEYLSTFEHDPVYDFLVGSYFIAFRSDIIRDLKFQRIFNRITTEKKKRHIVQKYEIGLTRFLIGHGYEFETWLSKVWKAPPVYTDAAFELLENGFPLLKRYLISENHYRNSSISYWKAALTKVESITPVGLVERNFLRVSDAEKLYQNFHITKKGELPPAPLKAEVFAKYDKSSPKYDNYWGFPVCCYDHTLSDNTRAIFEYVKNDPDIVKVVFTRSKSINLDGKNVICVPLNSLEGQNLMVRCRNFFVRHGAGANLKWPLSSTLHNIINLWHGIPLKRIGTASLDLGSQRAHREAENSRLRAVISASDVDRLAMTAAYAPKTYDDIWLTGLPRHDSIAAPESDLQEFQTRQIDDIRHLLDGKKMVLYCPTFRNDQEDGYFKFSELQLKQLADFLETHDLIMAVREHPADTARQYSQQLKGERFLNVPSSRFPDVEMLYREAAFLVTDYSSCFIDYLLTGRPIVSFAYDFDSYKEKERGLFYDLEDVFPGEIALNFEQLIPALNTSVNLIGKPLSAEYEAKRRFFIKYPDAQNSARVVERVREICEGSKLARNYEKVENRNPKSITFLYAKAGAITNRYRIFALISALESKGWSCEALDVDEAPLKLLLKSKFVSFCRLQCSSRTMDLAEFVRQTGGKVIFDTDDLVHIPEIFYQSEYFNRDPSFANKMDILRKNTHRMMMLADGFTVTTQSLLDSVTEFEKPSTIVVNSISRSLSKKFSQLPKKPKSDQVHVAYLSGTATHSADFDECTDALTEVLNNRENIVLHIVGKLDTSDLESKVEKSQIKKHGLMPYEAMHEFLRKIDINLAPLSDSAFNDAKSELKIFESALHGVPTIASPSRSYKAAITDGHNGLLARTTDEWSQALFGLVDDPVRRQKIGRNARNEIASSYKADIAAKQLSDFLSKAF